MKAGETRSGIDKGAQPWHGPLLAMSVAVMALLASLWLGYQFWRLIWQPAELFGRPVHPGAFDLIERYNEIRLWLAGQRITVPVYPPASYLMLWPLLGWLPLQWTIQLWAAASLAGAGWLSALAVRECGAEGLRPRLFAALLPLSLYATGATIGNGQLNLFVLPMLVAGILMLRRGPVGWPRDLMASLLILVSLVKPTFSAPFCWIVVLALGRWRPAALILLGYSGLALAASFFNPGGLVWQHYDWLVHGAKSAIFSSAVANVAPGTPTWPTEVSINALQYLLTHIGLKGWTLPASLAVFVALGLWVRQNCRADIWLLLGVSAIATRLLTYHRWYDDMLMLLPMLTLVRVVSSEARPGCTPAGWLLAFLLVTSLAPGGLFLLPPPWDGVYVSLQLTAWLATLGYLLSPGRQRR